MDDPGLKAAAPAAAETPPAPAAACVTCGAQLHGRYCHACGEKRLGASDRTVRAYLEHALETLTSIDSSPTLRSFRTLLLRPGELTLEHARGCRQRYLGPFKLFLVINVIYFLGISCSGSNTFTTPLGTYLQDNAFRWFARPMVLGRFGSLDAIPGAFREQFDLSSSQQAKTLVILLIPIFAALTAALQARRRRLVVDHLVFATHAMSFLLLLAIAVNLLLLALVRTFPGTQGMGGDGIVSLIMVLGMSAYLAASLRTVYGERKLAAWTKGLLLAGPGIVVTLTLYRMLLFFPVFLRT